MGRAAAAIVANERLIVPAHFDAEVYAAFRRLFRRKLVDRARVEASEVGKKLAIGAVALAGLLVIGYIAKRRVGS